MRFDFSNALSDTVQEMGIPIKKIFDSEEVISRAKEEIKKRIESDYYPLKLPIIMKKELKEINAYSKQISDRFQNFVVVGMGGSSLGNLMLQNALKGIYSNLYSKPRIFFLDNVDPESTAIFLQSIELKDTIFNVITKSGDTAETIQNFLTISQALKEMNLDIKEHFIFTTDPEKGYLRKLGSEMGIKLYPIHPLVGGRYSVLSHVGLLSAAVGGIDVFALVEGAERAYSNFIKCSPLENPSLILAFLQYEFKKMQNVNTTVLFSYSDGLYYVSEWYKQLLAESIGKKYSRDKRAVYEGILPLPARGTTDQHSMLQLLMEGPFDKIIIFLYPLCYRNDLFIKNEFPFDTNPSKHLTNKAYSNLIMNELKATRAALTKSKRPNLSIELDSISEEELGKLIFSFEISVLALGELFNVNPIDQPAVEIGKKYTYALMGKEGFEKAKEDFESLDSSLKEFEITI